MGSRSNSTAAAGAAKWRSPDQTLHKFTLQINYVQTKYQKKFQADSLHVNGNAQGLI